MYSFVEMKNREERILQKYDEALANSQPPYSDNFFALIERELACKSVKILKQIEEFGLQNRIKYINYDTLVVDSKYFYYIDRGFAKVKGNKKKYYVKDFQHFKEVFLDRR